MRWSPTHQHQRMNWSSPERGASNPSLPKVTAQRHWGAWGMGELLLLLQWSGPHPSSSLWSPSLWSQWTVKVSKDWLGTQEYCSYSSQGWNVVKEMTIRGFYICLTSSLVGLGGQLSPALMGTSCGRNAV